MVYSRKHTHIFQTKQRDEQKRIITDEVIPSRLPALPAPTPTTSGYTSDCGLVSRISDPHRKSKSGKTELFTAANGGDETGRDKVENRICRFISVSDYWYSGFFALEPIDMFNDQKTLTMQFFWQDAGIRPGKYRLGPDSAWYAQVGTPTRLDTAQVRTSRTSG
jgi:hypothetical protein